MDRGGARATRDVCARRPGRQPSALHRKPGDGVGSRENDRDEDGVASVRRRGSVVIVRGRELALIKRVNAQGEYYVFPGGGAEDGETPEEAAIREAREELGVEVRLTGLLALVTFDGGEQYYYAAEIVGGVFGTGTGEEMSLTPESPKGTCTPVWVALDELARLEIRPRPLADRLAAGLPAMPGTPWRITVGKRPPDCTP